MRRSASDVDSTRPACFASCAIGIPAPAVASVTSGMFSGSAPSRNRDSNSASAASAAAAEWNRATISFASSTFASRGLRPPSHSRLSAAISSCVRNDSSVYQRHISTSDTDISLPNISAAGSVMPM